MLALALAEHFDFPALALGVACVHPKQVAREDRGLVAAGAGADFEKDIRVVLRILGHQELREFEPLGCDARLEFAHLVRRQLVHLGIARARHLLDRVLFLLEPRELPEALRDRLETRILHGQVAKLVLA